MEECRSSFRIYNGELCIVKRTRFRSKITYDLELFNGGLVMDIPIESVEDIEDYEISIKKKPKFRFWTEQEIEEAKCSLMLGVIQVMFQTSIYFEHLVDDETHDTYGIKITCGNLTPWQVTIDDINAEYQEEIFQLICLSRVLIDINQGLIPKFLLEYIPRFDPGF